MNDFLDISDKISDFAGLLVVGDIHGNWSEFEVVLQRAKDENLFIVSLGDVMDYGFENIKCFNALYELIKDDKAIMLIGNHEFKLFKYINQARESNVRIRRYGGILTTIENMDQLTPQELTSFEDDFLENYKNSYFILQCGDYYFAHGAIDTRFWSDHKFAKSTKSMAMFGQVDTKSAPREDGYPIRRYDWVDSIPNNKTVVVGHDIRSKSKPYIQKSKLGGEAIFLDTGSSKGGQLSSMNLTF